MSVPNYELYLGKPKSFYGEYERKSGNHGVTHYCPGCGHGELHKMIAESLVELGVQDDTVLVSPVGCSVFAYYYFDVGNVQSAHGRAPAVGTGVQRARPNSIVISYQGDGDLAAIGLNEILQAANRGEHMAVFFVNNAIYGMTGGQMAPTTLPGMTTTTSPLGRDTRTMGNPLKMCEIISQLEAPVFVSRGALAGTKEIMAVRRLVRKALTLQKEKRGFTFVEVLSTCPTGWGMQPVDSQKFILEKMVPFFPIKTFVDKSDQPYEPFVPPTPAPRASVSALIRVESTETRHFPPSATAAKYMNPRLKISGFGGQGVLLLGLGVAQCGMLESRNVTWLPSYGPEMRGGTAHCHVNINEEEIGSPLVSRPTVLMALNQPSVEKFEAQVVPGGLIMTNSSMVPERPSRTDVELFEVPASEIAAKLGNARMANMVVLGAYAGYTGVLAKETCVAALDTLIKKKTLVELNVKAIEEGYEFGRAKRR
jgi:2-oxoisovalerate ferredoxin oxidoreductase beta subunit